MFVNLLMRNNLTDIEALEYFFSKVLKLKSNLIKIRLRLHPLESESKYMSVINNYKDSIKIGLTHNSLLSDDLNWSTLCCWNACTSFSCLLLSLI